MAPSLSAPPPKHHMGFRQHIDRESDFGKEPPTTRPWHALVPTRGAPTCGRDRGCCATHIPSSLRLKLGDEAAEHQVRLLLL